MEINSIDKRMAQNYQIYNFHEAASARKAVETEVKPTEKVSRPAHEGSEKNRNLDQMMSQFSNDKSLHFVIKDP